ncbi:MAG: AmmeMemoRadiSam system protein B [Candidatus Magasanikbacteria bacterium RIFCSPHIGHO2_01_FULL_41_23]|uniref:AmmeMemoRadiSam system protein B n=1 Tax=Candidatus Magasanikbacteria bacterium RIFCSPLOWO2_01_FULL_40_15 TaxID=1798686 RepID=A0A1F6N3X4_9BACT|nr:MAG: AmmeMemoRadiSam system protein B [Candidatus Magasanikbacteria bacterium RIFCSPHIGHO2_01_FULL_41_23]OGH76603.1 MAG: AmmeMemoRadiSam system protein B [Candidatus Magasanikbacteria bacterium RIFCSPHIGHO2_12_FULL_41_16]OGH78581.1 MAG: AmmeMemoRadiSam system protein B [Candidatus Magasanikbacteria bacterium RIFCSPLOWO2_01_FULL_40_15]
MAIVFSAIVPHPPVLLPNAPEVARDRLASTRAALAILEQELYVSRPNLLIIISPHAGTFLNAFTVHGHPTLTSCFAEFGDVVTKRTWLGAPEMAAKISHRPNQKVIPVQMSGEERLDHGVSIPLLFLTEHLANLKILPLGFSNLPPKKHFEFGELIKEVLMEESLRCAVVASGDLSHTLTPKSPGKFNPRGKEFERTIIELLCAKNTVGIANMDPALVLAADECGYRSILILLGILKNSDSAFQVLAHEAPFGVGYLTGIFHH